MDANRLSGFETIGLVEHLMAQNRWVVLVYHEIGEGRLKIKPYVEKHPLADINQILDAAHHGKLLKRAVLVP